MNQTNQLTGFNSNRLYVYLIKQSPYCKKKEKKWDFLVVFLFAVMNPYCITSLTVSMVPTSWFPALIINFFFVELGTACRWLLIFAIIAPRIPVWANIVRVCTLPSMLYLWYSYVPCKSERKQKCQGIFHTKDSATLTTDAVVRQTVLQFGIWRVWLSLWYCRLAWVRDDQTWQNISNELIRKLADLNLNGLPQERIIAYTYY